MTFELYNEWVKVARWVWVLGQKSLVGLNNAPITPLHPSQYSEQGCSALSYVEIQTQHLVCPRWPKSLEKAIKSMAGAGENCSASDCKN